MEEKKAPRRSSDKDRVEALLESINKKMEGGATAEAAFESLTVEQFDFLIEQGIDTDSYILTSEQQATIKKMSTSPRPTGLVYHKKYPEEKKNLYLYMVEKLTEYGAIVQEREKQNYRDIDFTVDGKTYKIVLSEPRTKKD